MQCLRCQATFPEDRSGCPECGATPETQVQASKRVRTGLSPVGPINAPTSAPLPSGPVDPATRPAVTRPPPAPHAEVPPGVRERFAVSHPLGTGGMGIVWLARDLRLGREVAIKLIRHTTPDLEKRFAEEARLLAGLEHRHVVRIYDFGVDAGVSYLIMELVRGKALSMRLAEGRPTAIEAVRITVDVLSGITEAHRQGVVHRDLKPGNVFLDPTGRAKVADFGLASRVEPSAEPGRTSGLIVGTPGYMAPEQTRGEVATPAADTYSVAVMLHEMLTGQRLFTGNFPQIVAAQARTVAPPSAANPAVPPALDELVTRGLAPAPGERPDASELRKSLLAWLDRVTRTGRAALSEAGAPTHPYKLLEHMGREDAAIFFGRDDEVAEILELLDSPRVRVMFLFGPCGIGKSSLLRAGVLASLDAARHEPVVLTGGADPARVLREAIVARALAMKVELPSGERIAPSLVELKPRLVLDLLLLAQGAGARTPVIVLDQLEEVFTQNPRGSPRITALHDLVAQLVEAQALNARVILSFRTEFRGELFPLEERLRLYQRTVGVREIALKGLVEAIEGPSRIETFRFGWEPGFPQWLAEDILRTTQDRGESVLPVMQIVCRQLYDNARARGEALIGRELYDSVVGGTSGALRRYVEERLASPEYAQAGGLPRQVLKLLTTRDDGGERFARPLDEEELLAFPDPERARNALERLLADHLVIREATDGGRRRVRLASEVICTLVDAWDLEPDDTERAARVLARAHRHWEEEGRLARDLLPAGALALVQRQALYLKELPQGEVDYLEESRSYHNRRRLTLVALVCLPLVAMFAALFVAVTLAVGTQVAETEVHRLESARLIVNEFMQRHYERLLGESRVIAESPRLIAAMETGDPPTVSAEAEHYRAIVKAALFILTDARGRVLASLGTAPGQMTQVLPGMQPGKPAFGAMAQGHDVFLVVSVPLETQAGPAGRLTTGFQVDHKFVELIKSLVGAEVIVSLAGEPVVHTLREADRQALAAALAEQEGRGNPAPFAIGGTRYLPLVFPMPHHVAGPPGHIALLRSLAASQSFIARMRAIVGLFDVAALGLTLLLYAYLLRRWYQ